MTQLSNEGLFAAAKSGSLERVGECLASGADINAGNGMALRWATSNGHLQTAQYLISRGANFGKVEKSSWWSKYIDKTTMGELSYFAIILSEQKYLKDLDGAAPAMGVRSQSRRI